MALTTERKAEIVKEYGLSEGDTGSPEVQIALLTANIESLQGHLNDHNHSDGGGLLQIDQICCKSESRG